MNKKFQELNDLLLYPNRLSNMFKKVSLLALFLFMGCQPEGLTPVGEHAGNSISKFSYNNHDFIQFDNGVGQSRVRSIIHSPECHCLRQAEVNH